MGIFSVVEEVVWSAVKDVGRFVQLVEQAEFKTYYRLWFDMFGIDCIEMNIFILN